MTQRVHTAPHSPPSPTAKTVADLADEMNRFQRRTLDFLKTIQPTEVKDITVRGSELPVLVQTSVAKVVGVIFLRAAVKGAAETQIDAGSCAWYPSANPQRPGVWVGSVGPDMDENTYYDLRVMFVGAR